MALAEKQTAVYMGDVKSDDTPPLFDFDPVAEKKLIRKCDIRVVPALFTIFLLAFLDRTNIGNARIQGLTEELKMVGNDYNVALLVFFIPYILFEVPSNILIKRLAPSTYLSAIMVLWGIATIGQGLITTQGGLIAMRVLVGLFEAGLFPGCVYLISMYYKRYELQWRLSLFFSASIVAGAFGGLFAFALAKMDGIAGYGGWRWIFIIEGILTVIVGAIAKLWIVDWPETAKFLNEDERTMLVARLKQDNGGADMNTLDKRAWKRIIFDWKIYCGFVMYFGIVNTGYSTSYFVPTIIREMGYTSASAQIRSIPVFACAAVCSLSTAWLTDRLRHRYSFCMLGILIATVGYAILLAQQSSDIPVGVKYLALFVITSGGYICQPITLAWVSNCMSGHYKRAISSAFQVGFGNLGGIVASNVYVTKEAPLYPTGYGSSLGLLWVCAAACTVLFLGVTVENKKRDRGERNHRLEEPDADNLGDDHPHFRFAR